MKLKIARLCANIAYRLDPSLKIFSEAVSLDRQRSLGVMAAKWRSINWTNALKYVNVEGGNAECDHANTTAIKKYRTQDWVRDCKDCGAKLFLYHMDMYSSIKSPRKSSKQYKIASALYAQELSLNPDQPVIAFEALEIPAKQHYFRMSNELLHASD